METGQRRATPGISCFPAEKIDVDGSRFRARRVEVARACRRMRRPASGFRTAARCGRRCPSIRLGSPGYSGRRSTEAGRRLRGCRYGGEDTPRRCARPARPPKLRSEDRPTFRPSAGTQESPGKKRTLQHQGWEMVASTAGTAQDRRGGGASRSLPTGGRTRGAVAKALFPSHCAVRLAQRLPSPTAALRAIILPRLSVSLSYPSQRTIHIQRSTINVQRSTFNDQRSTINAHRNLPLPQT